MKTTTVSIKFSNNDDEPIYIQVDPWAGWYLLNKGEEIEILAESETTSPSFDIEETGRTKRLTIVDSSEYYVVRNGQRVFWKEYYLDHRLCIYCLQLMKSEEESGKLYCTCEKSVRARSS